ncbi:reverse transcriptase domain-containing protein [Tanacetum coccineum]
MMIATTAFIRGEAAAAVKKKGHASWKAQDQFTPLTRTPREILAAKARKFKPPPPMVTPVEKRNSNKFCDIHNDKGHSTDECMHLKKQIEELVRAGKLSHLIKEIKQGRDQPKVGKKEVSAKDKFLNGSALRALLQPAPTRNQEANGPGNDIVNRFSGETIWPLAQLRLLVTIGDAVHSTKAWMNFMIVRMIKFPVDGGIVTIRSTILIPDECAMVITSSKETPKEAGVHHENIKVALHPNFPDQEVAIGGTLSAKGRTKLCSLLKENLDIFAWQPRNGARPQSVQKPSKWRNVTPFQKLIGKLNLSAATPLSVSWTLTKAITRYRWQSQMKRKQLSIPAIGYIAIPKFPSALRTLAPRTSGWWTKLLTAKCITSLQATKAALVRATPADGTQTEGGTDHGSILGIRALQDPELNYTPMEKLVISLVFAAKRLRRYFQAHPIAVIIDQPIKKIISRPDVAGRLKKWSVMLGEHNITYRPRTSVKGQILADFLVEKLDDSPLDTSVVETSQELWTLFTNGSLYVDGSDTGFILTSPKGTDADGSTQCAQYLKEGTLPDDKKEASKLYIKAKQYKLWEGILYRLSFLKPWLRCVGPLQADYVIREIHEGSSVQFRRTSLTGFLAQSIRSSNAIALDSPYLLVLITRTSQSRQHESRKSPTKSLFDVGSRRISIVTVNTKEYHSDVLAIITRIMRKTY